MSDFIKTNKAFRFNVDVVKAEGDVEKEFYVEGYASTPDLDRQGDIILLEALKEAAKELVDVNNTVFFGHSYDLPNSVGLLTEARVDEYGLKVKIFVSSVAKELRIKLKEGIISKFSIGGRVLQDKDVPREEAIELGLMKEEDPFPAVKVIEKMELFEVSFVGVPANAAAHVVETFAKALHSIYKKESDDMSDDKGGADMKDIEKKDLEKDQEQIADLESKETVEETKKEDAPEVKKEEETPEGAEIEEPSKESKEEPEEEITIKEEMYVCPSCGWKGAKEDLVEGKCPECGEDVKVLEEEKSEDALETKEETPEEEVKETPETEPEAEIEPEAEEEVKDDDVVSEEDIKALVDDVKETDEGSEDPKPYIQMDTKEVKAELMKLSEKLDKLDKIEEALKAISELKTLIEEKVKTIEVSTEKKSVVKKDENVDRVNKQEKKTPEQKDKDVDEGFYKYITGKK